MKKKIAIQLAVLFLVTVTAGAVSASSGTNDGLAYKAGGIKITAASVSPKPVIAVWMIQKWVAGDTDDTYPITIMATGSRGPGLNIHKDI
jgi:hypothetical protein